MLSYWATFNGLIIDGLAFAALTGIRTGNKELVEKYTMGNCRWQDLVVLMKI